MIKTMVSILFVLSFMLKAEMQSSNEIGVMCFAEAAQEFGVDAVILNSIALVESKMRVDAINTNKDGTQDIGLMQINSSHLPRLKRSGITKKLLLNDPCVNVMVGAAILSDFKKLYGGNEWQAVGAYNAGASAGTAAQRKAYILKVKNAYNLLTEPLS